MVLNYFLDLYRIRKAYLLSNSEIEDMQMQKLCVLIKHAYANVPYYRMLFDRAGIKPRDVINKNALSKIPIVSKEEISKLGLADRIAERVDINRCKNLRTSGSTGRPLDIYSSEKEILRSETLPILTLLLNNGCIFTDRILRITHPRFFTNPYWFQHFNILREYFLSIFGDIEQQLKQFIQIKPHVIRGYASAIKSLALKIKESGERFIPPKIIFTTAEVMSNIDREIISSAFQTEVIDYYCCNEVGIIAWECKMHRGYHVNVDNAIVEFIKDGRVAKAGEESDIVVTGLNNFIMPFIRYKIGDKGIFKEEKCQCNNNAPLISKIVGRDNDQIILSNGPIISSHLLTSLITGISGIREFQIIQKEIDKIIINIIKENTLTDEYVVNRVREECQNVLGNSIKIDPLIRKTILREESGKLKVVKNEIDSSRLHLP